ncbi:MAG: hypothetical protein HYT71_00475 [Candidatus Aenigmarchaeota archaeon]|nr:hypothetical protein [Candidatus Aenigmarchaeota archaeon]
MKRVTHYGHLSIKFLDVMFGAIIALGFGQWFSVPEREIIFFIAFVFAHTILIDVWINYDPTIRKFPTKNPYFLILDLALIFTMAFLVYYSMFNLQRFLVSAAVLRTIGILWSERPLKEYKIRGSDSSYLKYVRKRNFFEAAAFALLAYAYAAIDPSAATVAMIPVWVIFRLYDSSHIKNIIKSDS